MCHRSSSDYRRTLVTITAAAAPVAAPAVEFVRDRLPALLGITEPPLTFAYAAPVDTNTGSDSAPVVARLAKRALAGHGEVDRVAAGLAYVQSTCRAAGLIGYAHRFCEFGPSARGPNPPI
ncbi:hypothetical protein ACTXG7_02290 [Mycolicibacterium sp. Dal123E01]|uniref:hypothetical protein n=1 Tax=Mycolicibacterium sp. Dal123E01 TaxID=3457578 RepID=UPI00403EBA0D